MREIFNELEFAKKIINGVDDDKIKKINQHNKLSLMAKYYLYHEHLNEDDTKEKLKNYMENNTKNFIWERSDSYLTKIVKTSLKYKPFVVENVEIYREEIEYIRSIKDLKREKVLFSFLIFSKINQIRKHSNKFYVNQDSKDIFEIIEFKDIQQRRELLIADLVNFGALELTTTVDNNSRVVNFAKREGELFCNISEFEKIGFQYEELMGICKTKRCEECGTLIRITNGRPNQYCFKCARDKQLESKRKHWKKTNTR